MKLLKKELTRIRDFEIMQYVSPVLFSILFFIYVYISGTVFYKLITGIIHQDSINAFAGFKQTIGLILVGPVLWIASISLSHFFNARKVKMITFVITLCCMQCALSGWAAQLAKSIFLDKIWTPTDFMNFDALLLPAMSTLFMVLGAFVSALPLVRFISFHLKRTDVQEKIREFDLTK